MSNIPVIRKDALVQLSVATGFIQRLQELSIYMLSEKTEQDIEAFTKLLDSGKTEFDEPWMTHYFTIMILLKGIDEAAVKQGFVDQVSEEEVTSLLDSSPSLQSAEPTE